MKHRDAWIEQLIAFIEEGCNDKDWIKDVHEKLRKPVESKAK